MARGLLLFGMGLAAGVVLGWYLFSGGARERSRETVRTVYVPSEGEPEMEPDESEVGEPADDYEPTGAPSIVTADRLRGATADDLNAFLADRNAAIAPDAVGVLAAQLDQARTDRDWNRFRTLLALLGKANTKEAQLKLIAVMGDGDLGFHRTRLGSRFYSWLKDAEVPGLVDAARTRLEREMKDNPGSRSAQRGWLALIAQHGSASDLDWIQAQADSRAGEREVLEAFVQASGRPDVAARLETMFRERNKRWYSGHLRTFARNNPERALPLIEEGLSNPKRGEERDLARVYGEAVRADQVEHARSFLLGLNTPAQRTAAVYAVERMKKNGHDVSGMDSIVLAPVQALERYGQDPKGVDLYQARYAIERNPITWSERTAAALEAAAETAPRSQRAGLLAAAKKVRAGIGSPDSEWVDR